MDKSRYLRSVGLRWLGGLTAVVGLGSLELIDYTMASQPLADAILSNWVLVLVFVALLAASLFALFRESKPSKWISYLLGATAGPLILWGLGSYLEGPALGWVSLSTALVVGFAPLPGIGAVNERRAADEIIRTR